MRIQKDKNGSILIAQKVRERWTEFSSHYSKHPHSHTGNRSVQERDLS